MPTKQRVFALVTSLPDLITSRYFRSGNDKP